MIMTQSHKELYFLLRDISDTLIMKKKKLEKGLRAGNILNAVIVYVLS